MLSTHPHESAGARMLVYVLAGVLLLPFLLWAGAFFFRLRVDAPALLVLGVLFVLVHVGMRRR